VRLSKLMFTHPVLYSFSSIVDVSFFSRYSRVEDPNSSTLAFPTIAPVVPAAATAETVFVTLELKVLSRTRLLITTELF